MTLSLRPARRGKLPLATSTTLLVLLAAATIVAALALHWRTPLSPLAAASEPGAGTAFYVATNGNDHWSGKRATRKAGSSDGPFATLERARDALRAARAAGAAAPFVVYVRGGTYSLARPLLLGPRDSGTLGRPAVFRAYGNERPVLSGGRVITGWKRGAGHLFTVRLPDVAAGRWNFNALFVAGVRATRARIPELGKHFHIVPPALAGIAPGSELAYRCFAFHPGDIDPHWKNLGQIEVVSDRLASQSRSYIERIEGDRVLLRSHAARPYGSEQYNSGQDRYYLDNVYEGLTGPGEWYLDSGSGVLSYWPLPGQDMSRTRVVAPALSTLLEVNGDTGRLDLGGAPFTISAWVKTPDAGTRNLVSNWFPDAQYEMAAHDETAVNGYAFGLSGGRFFVGVNDYGSRPDFGFFGGGLNDNRWHLLSAVYDLANRRITGYVDGRLSGTVSLSRSFANFHSDLPVLLGDFYQQPYEASLDRLLIYKRALTSSEIAGLYGAVGGYPRRGLEVALDLEGNLNDDAHPGRAAVGNEFFDYVPGVAGQALHRGSDPATARGSGPEHHFSFPWNPGPAAHDIEITGLTFSDTASSLLPSGYPGYQSNMFLKAPPVVGFLNATRIALRGDSIAHAGGDGFRQTYSSLCTVTSSEVYDCAANGIVVAGGNDNQISENNVHDVGVTYGEGTGIIVGIQDAVSGGNRIEHNTVANTPYAGISIGMTWRTEDRGQNENITQWNRVSRAMQELNDGGGIYSNGLQRNALIANNVVTDSHNEERTDLWRAAGIYLDNGSQGVTLRDNLTARNGCNIFLNATHGVVVENNYLIDGLSSEAFLFDDHVHLLHNIFYDLGAPASAKLFSPASALAVMPKQGGEADYNLYFNASHPAADDWQLLAWRGIAGLDRHGVVADPLFADYSAGNFDLSPSSPARTMGIDLIDYRKAGAAKFRAAASK